MPPNNNGSQTELITALNSIAIALQTQKPGASDTSYVVTDESTTSTSYTTLTTDQSVSVVVGVSGQLLVLWSAGIYNAAFVKRLSIAVTGPNSYSLSPSDDYSIRNDVSGFQAHDHMSHLLKGLTPGTYTVGLRVKTAGGTARFFERRLIAIPL